MRLSRWHLAVLMALAAVQAGCTFNRGCRPPKTHLPLVAGPSLLLAQRGTIDPDYSNLGAHPQPEALRPPEYHPLTAREAQCYAAEYSPLARLVELEIDAAATELQRELLSYRADEHRNRAAAQALEVYFQLTEGEGTSDLVDRQVNEIDVALDQVEMLRERGLEVPLDVSELDRRRLELDDRRVQLEAGIRAANAQLRRLIGLDPSDTQPIWPLADLVAETGPIDVESAIDLALASRPELMILERLSQEVDKRTLPVARAVLAQADPALGSATSRSPFAKAGPETPIRSEQIDRLLIEKRRGVAVEVTQAAREVEAEAKRMEQAQLLRTAWATRLHELREGRTIGKATPLELTDARLREIEAERELLHHLIAWKLAQVRLKAAQGTLSAECGFCHDSCRCEGCASAAGDVCGAALPDAPPAGDERAVERVEVPAEKTAEGAIDTGAIPYFEPELEGAKEALPEELSSPDQKPSTPDAIEPPTIQQPPSPSKAKTLPAPKRPARPPARAPREPLPIPDNPEESSEIRIRTAPRQATAAASPYFIPDLGPE